MLYRFEYRPYQRHFRQPLKTHHGLWRDRQGLLLKLTDSSGQVHFGEIAPLAWFGSETFEQAYQFCQQLPSYLSIETILGIPDQLPACQFGFESAIAAPMPSQPGSQRFSSEGAVSALLPAGAAALSTWQPLWQQGYCTFKWKIGVQTIQTELAVLERLVDDLPASARLRLDANGGLSQPEAHQWLQTCDRLGIEWLEQPLPPSQFDALLVLAQQYQTPLALDESVATIAQLQTCYQNGWRDIFVIKPAIAGSPRQLQQFCQTSEIDLVFSSVFETRVARWAALQLAEALSRHSRAQGFGVNHWFEDDWDCSDQSVEQLWQRL